MKKALTVFALVSPIVLAQSSTLGIRWNEIKGNPALVGGPCLSWRCAGVTDPTLVPNTAGNLSVWFTTVGIQQDAVTQAFSAQGPYIGSADSGTTLTALISPEGGNPVVPVGAEGTWDRFVETPTVRRDPQTSLLTMWYMGCAAPGLVASAIGQMTSADTNGKTWTRPSGPIYRPAPGAWDSALVTGPTVVKGPDGLWRLYYTGLGTKHGIGLLTSRDGVNWTPYSGNPVMEVKPGAWDDQILEQTVIYHKGKYWMWYSGYKGQLQSSTAISIGLATSTDGIRWTRYKNNPVLKPGAAGSWNDLRVLAPDIIVQEDGSLLMVAYGQSRTDIGVTAGSIGFWQSN